MQKSIWDIPRILKLRNSKYIHTNVLKVTVIGTSTLFECIIIFDYEKLIIIPTIMMVIHMEAQGTLRVKFCLDK